MSDTGTPGRADALSVRIVYEIDALPVPAGPGGLRPRRTLVAQLDRRPLLILVLVGLAVALSTPAGRSAVAEAARLIQRMIGTPPWSAYYVDVAARDAAGVPAGRLMFAKGAFPGTATQPDVVSSRLLALDGNRGRGWWSDDGELFAIGAGSKVYLGDRAGRVREVADTGEANNVMEVAWTGRRRLSAVAREAAGDVVFMVDLDAGIVSHRPLPHGTRIDAAPDHVWKTFSPDGRWLIIPEQSSVACRSVHVYDLTSDRMVELLDGVQRRGLPIGWLRDSRLLWATCDTSVEAASSDATRLNVFVSAPDGSSATAVGAIPWTSASGAPAVDQPRDRVLFSSPLFRAPVAGAVVWSLALDGQITELFRFPQIPDLTRVGVAHLLTVSRDGRLLAFRYEFTIEVYERSRAGFIDLETGAVTFACDIDCRGLGVR